MRITGTTQWAQLLGLLFIFGGISASDATEPTATPTPPTTRREIHIGEYAGRVEIDRSGLEETGGPVVITNQLVKSTRDRGTLTTGPSSPLYSGPTPTSHRATPTPAGPRRRSYWQSRVHTQRRIISQVQRELRLLDARIDALEDAAFQGGIRATSKWAKLAENRSRRKVVDRRLHNERARLSAIIRAARREGAEPGWFR
jgi:hypothetical protein